MGYATFLRLDGICGECIEEAHRGWLVVDSFSHSLCGAQPQGGQVTLADLSIARFVDRATPLLAQAAAEGRIFKEAVLELCRTDGTKGKFMEIRLSRVRVTMHSLSGGPQTDMRTPYENLSVGFDKIEWHYYPAAFEAREESGADVRTGWSSPSALATV
ncbi:MAG TPA: type VI secretion system tube protein Hcp [Planctomycetota bacterium]|nr:type VI secretion system tube protein Hcp [Planctomycetota bacterium]